MSHDTNLRDAKAEFLNMFNERANDSVFDGLTMNVDAKDGYATLATITRNATFKKFEGELRPEGLDTAKLTYETDVYKAGIEIPRETFDHAESLMGSEYGKEVLNIAADAIDNRDEKLTAMLEDNGTDITGSAFFGDAKAMKNSDYTIDNLLSGGGVTSALIQTDFWAVLQLLQEMVNAAGRPYHGNQISKSKVVIMYPPALESAMQNAFAAARQASGADNILFNRAELRANGHLNDANDWYGFVQKPRYPALAMGNGASVTTESDATAGVGRDVIIHETYLFAARDEFVTMYGSPLSCVKVSNA